jgi:hypothetical protein
MVVGSACIVKDYKMSVMLDKGSTIHDGTYVGCLIIHQHAFSTLALLFSYVVRLHSVRLTAMLALDGDLRFAWQALTVVSKVTCLDPLAAVESSPTDSLVTDAGLKLSAVSQHLEHRQ